MVWPQMDWARFRNLSNFDLVKLNRIMDSIYAHVKSGVNYLFSVENVAYMYLPFDITSVTCEYRVLVAYNR